MCNVHVAPCSMKVARDPKVNNRRMPLAASASAWCSVVFLDSNEAQPRRGLRWSRIKHPNSCVKPSPLSPKGQPPGIILNLFQ
ncbi:expressed protein [Echinococcus multilocularis]|uniref:Expressed protein n=1 Tax=Echinococcus multilocularis TaxID=6211 RepID=A0A068YP04_ECHMU|nr:expressed protein [Echinococcus multilocularis]